MPAPKDKRIAELEAIVRSQKTMLSEIAQAAGYHIGESYTAAALLARLRVKHGKEKQ